MTPKRVSGYRLPPLGTLVLLLFCNGVGIHPQTPAGKSVLPELVVQSGHNLKVNSVVFSPDRKLLISGGADNKIIIWSVETGRELRLLSGHTGYVNALAVSKDGEWLASGSNDHTVKVWNISRGKELPLLFAHAAPVQTVAFSANGQWIVSGSTDGVIKIWETATAKEARTFPAQSVAITYVGFSPDGTLLATGGRDGSVKLWDTATWRETTSLKKLSKQVTALAFNAENSLLSAGSEDGAVSLCDLKTKKERLLAKAQGTSVLSLILKADNTLIAANADGSLKVWDSNSGKETHTVPRGNEGEDFVSSALSADGELVARGSGNMTIEIRQVSSNQATNVLEGQTSILNVVAFSGDGRWLAAGANDGAIRLWQTATGREMPRLTGHTAYVTTLAFSNDSQFLASGSTSGEVKVWDLSSGRALYSLPNTGSIDVVAFSPDGKSLAAAGMQPAIQIWDLETKRARSLVGHTEEVTSLAFSRDGQILASGGRDKTIKLWRLDTGNSFKTIGDGVSEINSVTFSPDSQLLAAGNSDHTVKLWAVGTGSLVHTLSSHSGEVLRVAFRPDGRMLASAGHDHNIKLWDVASGREVSSLAGPTARTNGLDFNHDGQWLLTGSDDGSMAVWDGTTGALMATLVSIRESDDWLVTTPDGLFDGSPAAWNLLLWRFGNDTASVLPVESFFNEYYYPGLLADVLANKKPHAPEVLTAKDRRQPQVRLSYEGDVVAIEGRTVKLKLEVAEAAPDNEHANGSGATDLRLFRNGLLIHKWTGDVLRGQKSRLLETNIPLVSGSNRITAYAFNSDGIKSSDTRLLLKGNFPKRTGTAYVLAIGISHYQNSQYDLEYPVADASAVSELIKNEQSRLARYDPIVVIQLSNEEATKANILLALKRLSGVDSGPLPQAAPAALARIKPVKPEDALVVYYSGHGDAQKDRFYLVPYDLGYQGRREELNDAGLQAIFAHSISDLELEEALSPLDLDQLLLLIDACKSGHVLDSEEKRRGPMNTKGLAQLAYEKGIYVLTASQSNEVAFESDALKHSYLVHALIDEGISSKAADLNHDNQIQLREWYSFATQRVPQIRREKISRGKRLTLGEADEEKVQRPRFFYTRTSDAGDLVIATFGKDKAPGN